MEQTECSETSAYKIQTPGNYPEKSIQQYTTTVFGTKTLLFRILSYVSRQVNAITDGGGRFYCQGIKKTV